MTADTGCGLATTAVDTAPEPVAFLAAAGTEADEAVDAEEVEWAEVDKEREAAEAAAAEEEEEEEATEEEEVGGLAARGALRFLETNGRCASTTEFVLTGGRASDVTSAAVDASASVFVCTNEVGGSSKRGDGADSSCVSPTAAVCVTVVVSDCAATLAMDAESAATEPIVLIVVLAMVLDSPVRSMSSVARSA